MSRGAIIAGKKKMTKRDPKYIITVYYKLQCYSVTIIIIIRVAAL